MAKARKHLDSGYSRPDLNFNGKRQQAMLKQGMAEAKEAIARHESTPEPEAPKPVSHVEAANMAHTASQIPTNTLGPSQPSHQPSLIEEEVEEVDEVPVDHTEVTADDLDENDADLSEFSD